mmetsp:Transcript_25853/g.49119  ORF Transcript_25853/g.49119 Transcript_25853/m.49119 type:complete len:273 (-) Transcript_25853:697-1515(-)
MQLELVTILVRGEEVARGRESTNHKRHHALAPVRARLHQGHRLGAVQPVPEVFGFQSFESILLENTQVRLQGVHDGSEDKLACGKRQRHVRRPLRTGLLEDVSLPILDDLLYASCRLCVLDIHSATHGDVEELGLHVVPRFAKHAANLFCARPVHVVGPLDAHVHHVLHGGAREGNTQRHARLLLNRLHDGQSHHILQKRQRRAVGNLGRKGEHETTSGRGPLVATSTFPCILDVGHHHRAHGYRVKVFLEQRLRGGHLPRGEAGVSQRARG